MVCAISASAESSKQRKPDAEVVKILAALQPGQSVLLPPVKTSGNLDNAEVKRFKLDKTGPRPRDYCLKWVWAPDRERALFCGGNAGVPHKLNDVWEYDLASNTWVLLWAPDPDTNRVRHMSTPGEAKSYLDGFVHLDEATGEIMTKRGAPFDPVHTWWALTYDPELKALLWVMGNHHLHDDWLKMQPEATDHYRLDGYHKMRLWAYYPERNKWDFVQSAGPPKSPAAILEYIPEKRGSFYYSETHLQSGYFHSTTRDWSSKKVAESRDAFNANPNLPRREAVCAYDSRHRILVVHHGGGTHNDKPVPKRTYHFDVTNDRWTKVLESNEGPMGYDNRTPMVYDSVSGRHFIVEKDALWSYAIGEKKWTRHELEGASLESPRAFMACYNPQYNVLMADDGSGRIWVYRHTSRPKP